MKKLWIIFKVCKFVSTGVETEERSRVKTQGARVLFHRTRHRPSRASENQIQDNDKPTALVWKF